MGLHCAERLQPSWRARACGRPRILLADPPRECGRPVGHHLAVDSLSGYLGLVSQPLRVPATFEELYEQILALPEHLTGEILEPGVLRTMSRPGKRHRRAAKRCMQSLGRFDVGSDGTGWWIEPEAEICFPGGRLLVPDLSGFRVERVADMPEENPLTILPDWCCEILSPRTARDDVTIKLPLYARSGVPWSWIVDPMRRLIEVFETIDGRPALTATAMDDDRVVLPPFDGEISIGPWWTPGGGDDADEESRPLFAGWHAWSPAPAEVPPPRPASWVQVVKPRANSSRCIAA